MNADDSTPPLQPSFTERIDQAFAAVEREASSRSPLSAVVADVRASAHRLRSAMTPVCNNLHYVLSEEHVSNEGQAALEDAQAALDRALESLDELVSSVRAHQPRFPLSSVLPSVCECPAWEIPGDHEYLAAALSALVGPQACVRAWVEGNCAIVEITGDTKEDREYAVALARRLLRRLDAQLDLVETRLRLRIPGVPVHARPGTRSAPRAGTLRSLLVVDDEPDLAPMFRRFLKRDFDEILEAESASQAESLLSSRPITHLVVDATLPDCASGAELIERCRKAAPSVAFAALFSGSAATMPSTAQPGVDGVFQKPDGFEDLLGALKKAGR